LGVEASPDEPTSPDRESKSIPENIDAGREAIVSATKFMGDAKSRLPAMDYHLKKDFKHRTFHIQQDTIDLFDDWADDQRRKARKKLISDSAPSSVQECADYVMRLGLAALGCFAVPQDEGS